MPLPRFEKLSDSKKKAILDAATREFAEHGFGAASYNRIIDLAGISKGAMYYYFSDKDDLYRTVLEAAHRMWMVNMRPPTAVTDAASYWRECEAVYARILHFFLAEPQSAALCWSISRSRRRGESHPALVDLADRLETWTGALIRIGQGVGAVRGDLPPDLLLHTGFAMLEGMDRWLATHWDDMTPDRVDETAHMLVSLIRRMAEPGPVPAPHASNPRDRDNSLDDKEHRHA